MINQVCADFGCVQINSLCGEQKRWNAISNQSVNKLLISFFFLFIYIHMKISDLKRSAMYFVSHPFSILN